MYDYLSVDNSRTFIPRDPIEEDQGPAPEKNSSMVAGAEGRKATGQNAGGNNILEVTSDPYQHDSSNSLGDQDLAPKSFTNLNLTSQGKEREAPLSQQHTISDVTKKPSDSDNVEQTSSPKEVVTTPEKIPLVHYRLGENGWEKKPLSSDEWERTDDFNPPELGEGIWRDVDLSPLLTEVIDRFLEEQNRISIIEKKNATYMEDLRLLFTQFPEADSEFFVKEFEGLSKATIRYDGALIQKLIEFAKGSTQRKPNLRLALSFAEKIHNRPNQMEKIVDSLHGDILEWGRLSRKIQELQGREVDTAHLEANKKSKQFYKSWIDGQKKFIVKSIDYGKFAASLGPSPSPEAQQEKIEKKGEVINIRAQEGLKRVEMINDGIPWPNYTLESVNTAQSFYQEIIDSQIDRTKKVHDLLARGLEYCQLSVQAFQERNFDVGNGLKSLGMEVINAAAKMSEKELSEEGKVLFAQGLEYYQLSAKAFQERNFDVGRALTISGWEVIAAAEKKLSGEGKDLLALGLEYYQLSAKAFQERNFDVGDGLKSLGMEVINAAAKMSEKELSEEGKVLFAQGLEYFQLSVEAYQEGNGNVGECLKYLGRDVIDASAKMLEKELSEEGKVLFAQGLEYFQLSVEAYQEENGDVGDNLKSLGINVIDAAKNMPEKELSEEGKVLFTQGLEYYQLSAKAFQERNFDVGRVLTISGWEVIAAAAKKLSGEGKDLLALGLEYYQLSVEAYQQGNGDVGDNFKSLGINVIDAAKNMPEKELSEEGKVLFTQGLEYYQLSAKALQERNFDAGRVLTISGWEVIDAAAKMPEKELSKEGKVLFAKGLEYYQLSVEAYQQGNGDVGDGLESCGGEVTNAAAKMPEKELSEEGKVLFAKGLEYVQLSAQAFQERNFDVGENLLFLEDRVIDAAAKMPEKELSKEGKVLFAKGLEYVQLSAQAFQERNFDVGEKLMYLGKSVIDAVAKMPEKELSKEKKDLLVQGLKYLQLWTVAYQQGNRILAHYLESLGIEVINAVAKMPEKELSKEKKDLCAQGLKYLQLSVEAYQQQNWNLARHLVSLGDAVIDAAAKMPEKELNEEEKVLLAQGLKYLQLSAEDYQKENIAEAMSYLEQALSIISKVPLPT